MAPDPAILNEFVRGVVDSVHPTRIIPFGSERQNSPAGELVSRVGLIDHRGSPIRENLTASRFYFTRLDRR